jgi:hypothetical protein
MRRCAPVVVLERDKLALEAPRLMFGRKERPVFGLSATRFAPSHPHVLAQALATCVVEFPRLSLASCQARFINWLRVTLYLGLGDNVDTATDAGEVAGVLV